MNIFEFSVPTHDGVEVEEIGDGIPMVEAKDSGVMGVVFENRSAGTAVTIEVPFSKVTGGVSCLFEGCREGFFLPSQGVSVVEDGGAIVAPAGENRGAGGRAIWRGVESVEAEAIFGHRVEVGSLENRVTVVAGFAPTLIVSHDEDDVGAFGGMQNRGGAEEKNEKGFHLEG